MTSANRLFIRLVAPARAGAAPALAVLAIALSATTIACTPPAEKKNAPVAESKTGEATVAPAAPSKNDFKRVARLFGESLLVGQYPAAYDLTSTRLRARMSLEKFSQICKQAVQQYGEPVQLGAVAIERTEGLAGAAASDQYGFPAEIPNGDRLAWLHLALALDVDEGEIIRYYDCWMLLENDGGKARIGHFSFSWSE